MRVGVGQSVPAGGRHQVVGWRAHPGEVLRVPLPVGQRPEGPDLEPRRRRRWRDVRRRGHDSDRRSVPLRGVGRPVSGAAGGRTAAPGRAGRTGKGSARGGGELSRRRRLRVVPPRPAAARATATRPRRPPCSRGRPRPSPDSRSILEALARAQYDAGRYEDAMAHLHRPDRAEPHRRLRPLRSRPGREQGRRAARWPPSTWPWPSRCAPTSGTTPGRCAGSAPGGRGSRHDRRRAPGRPAAPRRRARSTTSRCSTSTASSTSAPTPCPACPRRWPPPATPGMRLGFVTNNAARTPERGRRAPDRPRRRRPAGDDVITSSQAAATVVAELLGPGAPRARRSAARASPPPSPPPASPSSTAPRTSRPPSSRATAARSAGRSSPRRSSPSATAPGTSPPTSTRPSRRRAGPLPGNGAMVGVVSGDHRPGSRSSPASPTRRCTPSASAAPVPGGRSSSATGSTPTSRARAAPGAASLLVLTGVTDPRTLLAAAPRPPARPALRTTRPGCSTPHPAVGARRAGLAVRRAGRRGPAEADDVLVLEARRGGGRRRATASTGCGRCASRTGPGTPTTARPPGSSAAATGAAAAARRWGLAPDGAGLRIRGSCAAAAGPAGPPPA